MEQIAKLFIGNGMDHSTFGNVYDPNEGLPKTFNTLNMANQDVIKN
jgi:hypothetical protein